MGVSKAHPFKGIQNSAGLRLAARLGHSVTPIPLRFYDAANWLGYSQGRVYKLARQAQRNAPFWHGANALFGVDRWRDAQRLPAIPAHLPTGLPMPAEPMRYEGQLAGAPWWSQRWVTGQVAVWSNTFARTLGQQCALLERRRSTCFGRFPRADFSLSDWNRRVARYVESVSPHPYLPDIQPLLASMPAPPKSAVPLLLDLREDQFMHVNDGYRWLDWEAMVWAPVEFAWALIEILVPAAYRDAFLQGYGASPKVHHLPEWRPLYRALFVAMGLWGDVSLATLERYDCWLAPRG
ncbi:hypothetical protein [Carnimonas nigrificans]|uniref:hypothetical protein n=1 Tax=Carnimonas nigrificans TaxID=64323 RepID=UPI000472BF4D|nr:hypothetical protein [Carnimonas nigrificans]